MKKYVELIYRIAFIIVCGICVGIHFNVNDEYYNAHSFSFFTVQSNIFCLIVMCVLLIKHFFGRNLCSRSLVYFKGMVLSAIICTFLVYHFGECRVKYELLTIGILGLPIATLLSHYIVPFMFVLDWILFQPKGYFKWWHIGGWLAFPLMYFLSFITRCYCNPASAFENIPKYPYFFLDYETLGFKQFCGYIILMLVIMTAENILIVIADKFMKRSCSPK